MIIISHLHAIAGGAIIKIRRCLFVMSEQNKSLNFWPTVENGNGLDKKVFSQKASLAFGQAVRIVRSKMGVSQEGLAYKAEIQRSYMGEIERGEKNPSLAIILRIAMALDISTTVLLAEMEILLKIK